MINEVVRNNPFLVCTLCIHQLRMDIYFQAIYLLDKDNEHVNILNGNGESLLTSKYAQDVFLEEEERSTYTNGTVACYKYDSVGNRRWRI